MSAKKFNLLLQHFVEDILAVCENKSLQTAKDWLDAFVSADADADDLAKAFGDYARETDITSLVKGAASKMKGGLGDDIVKVYNDLSSENKKVCLKYISKLCKIAQTLFPNEGEETSTMAVVKSLTNAASDDDEDEGSLILKALRSTAVEMIASVGQDSSAVSAMKTPADIVAWATATHTQDDLQEMLMGDAGEVLMRKGIPGLGFVETALTDEVIGNCVQVATLTLTVMSLPAEAIASLEKIAAGLANDSDAQDSLDPLLLMSKIAEAPELMKLMG